MWGDEWPDPLDEEPFKAFAEEGSEAKISKIIFRLRKRDLVNGQVVFFLEWFRPGVCGNGFSVDGRYWGCELR